MATTRFCPVPANFGGNTYLNSQSAANVLKSVTDRRLDTGFDLSTSALFYLDLSSNRRVTHLYVRGVGITHISVDTSDVLDVTSYSVEDAQGFVSDWESTQERTSDWALYGFQHILMPLANSPVVDSVSVTVTGTRVVEIAAIDTRIRLDSESRLSRMDFRRVRRGSVEHRTITGRVRRVPPVNMEPYRWELDLGIIYLNRVSPESILEFFNEYPNFCMIPEYSRYPSRVFTEATLPQSALQLRYLDNSLKQHQILELTIMES